MAYERQWYPMPAQGPYDYSAHADNAAGGWINRFYRFLTNHQAVRGAGAQAWVVTGSSDGVAAATDGVDRWAAAGGLPANFVANTASAHAWITFRSPMATNGVYSYIHLKGCEAGGAGSTPITMSVSPIVQSLVTGEPSTSMLVHHSAVDQAFNLGLNYTSPSIHYGSMSANGDFWFATRAGGVTPSAFIVASPVGCAANDACPWYMRLIAGSEEPWASLFAMTAGTLTRWNTGGAGGYQTLNLPFIDAALLDVNGSKAFDLDTKAFVVNNMLNSSVSQATARGRLPDMGLITGRTTSNALPVATGTTIRDPATGLVAYVTLGALLVPYTGPI